MPQLEETRKLAPKTSPSGSDLLAIFDVTELSNNNVKKSTLLQVLTAVVAGLPGPFLDDATAASGGVAVGGLYQYDGAGVFLIAIRQS